MNILQSTLTIFGYILLGLISIWLILFILSKIKIIWQEELIPLRYKQPEKRRSLRRQRFARHIERETLRLNDLEEWRDYRFTELEAEVEAEGRRRRTSWLPFTRRSRSGLRRERSLSKAIEASEERLILVEGEPGSGKSVALRHVTLQMAQKAAKAKTTNSLIPIYINLKELAQDHLGNDTLTDSKTAESPSRLRQFLTDHFNETELRNLCQDLEVDYDNLPGPAKSDKARELVAYSRRHALYVNLVKAIRHLRPSLFPAHSPHSTAIDRNLIYAFVLKSLNRANDRDIEEFLDDEFDQGMKDGTWFFLFDSFDELPDVLSSTEADAIIRLYADAISDFLHGMNQCRGVIASRHFRGPGQVGWPRFRVLPLVEDRRHELIRRAELQPEVEERLLGQLQNANQEIRSMSKNPLFLGLLCEYMRVGNPFPQNTHTVFEAYITNRLTRDQDRLWRRFQIEPSQVRAAAESLAFAMAADTGLGLSPSRARLQSALVHLDLDIPGDFDTHLDALEYIKIARSETATAVSQSKSFTFAHRRFQEYFATNIVLREPDRVTPHQLLTDARWRETAVTLCQTQTATELSPLIAEARTQLQQMTADVPNLVQDPVAFICAFEEDEADLPEPPIPEPIAWPSGSLHLLGLLQSGFGSRLHDLPDDIRTYAAQLIITADYYGTIFDRKWGLENAGIVTTPVLLGLLRAAFQSSSLWLKEVAFSQTARLESITPDIAQWIRQTLILLRQNGRLHRERLTTQAHLTRLDRSEEFLAVFRLLQIISLIDFGIHLVFLLIIIVPLLVFVWLFPTNIVVLSFIMPINISTFAATSARINTFSNRSAKFMFWMAVNIIKGLAALYAVGYSLYFIVTNLLVTMGVLTLAPSLDPILIIALLMLYAWGWASFALLNAYMGQYIHPLWWPLLPLTPVLYFKQLLVEVFAFLKKHAIDIVLLLPILVLILLLLRQFTNLAIIVTEKILSSELIVAESERVVWSLLLAIIIYTSNRTRQSLNPHASKAPWISILKSTFFAITGSLFVFILLEPIFLLGFLLSCLVLPPLIARILWLSIRDISRWYHWRKNQSGLTEQTFLAGLSQFHFHYFAIQYTKKVREQNLLVASEYDSLLEKLVIAYEARQRNQDDNPAVPVHSDPFQQWLAAYTRKNKNRLKGLGPEFFDEICRIIEQAKTREIPRPVAETD